MGIMHFSKFTHAQPITGSGIGTNRVCSLRISFQKALVLHQSSKDDVEYNLGELSKRIGSVATIRDELLAYNSAVQQAFQ